MLIEVGKELSNYSESHSFSSNPSFTVTANPGPCHPFCRLIPLDHRAKTSNLSARASADTPSTAHYEMISSIG
jgi:hypothetical protein